jgi:hypothetical protein
MADGGLAAGRRAQNGQLWTICGLTALPPLDYVSTLSLSARVSRKKRTHERPLVAENAPALVPDAVGRHEIRVFAEEPAVLLICSEAREAEEGERLVTCTLGRQEVAMVAAALPVNQFHPPPGEAFEGVDLRRIDDILDDAGDHGDRLAQAAATAHGTARDRRGPLRRERQSRQHNTCTAANMRSRTPQAAIATPP